MRRSFFNACSLSIQAVKPLKEGTRITPVRLLTLILEPYNHPSDELKYSLEELLGPDGRMTKQEESMEFTVIKLDEVQEEWKKEGTLAEQWLVLIAAEYTCTVFMDVKYLWQTEDQDFREEIVQSAVKELGELAGTRIRLFKASLKKSDISSALSDSKMEELSQTLAGLKRSEQELQQQSSFMIKLYWRKDLCLCLGLCE